MDIKSPACPIDHSLRPVSASWVGASLSTDGDKCAVDNFRGNVIKALILSFYIENIVNFVMDVTV